MIRSLGRRATLVLALFAPFCVPLGAASAQSVMQQCGQQYQAAKAAGTLGGATWNQFRVECSARLKAGQGGATAAPAAAPAAEPANPLKPATAEPATAPAAGTAAVPPAAEGTPATTAKGKPVSPGRAAFLARQRQCGAEWRANKATLKTQTPGLTWPKYLSQCNARLKAAGQ